MLTDDLKGTAYGRELVRRLRALRESPEPTPEPLHLTPEEKVAASQAGIAIGAALFDSRLEVRAKREASSCLKRVRGNIARQSAAIRGLCQSTPDRSAPQTEPTTPPSQSD